MSTAALVGLDIGGSTVRGVRVEDGSVVVSALAGAANPSSVGPDRAGRELDRVLDALGRTGVAAVCAGAAGADTEHGRALLGQFLAERLPGARIHVVHDSALILAAAGVGAGIGLVAGTGSVAYGVRADGRTARAGGWGYVLGDEGSGFALVMDALRHVMRRVDRGLPPDALTVRLTEACGLDDAARLLDRAYADDRATWARRAPVLFALVDEGDAAATAVLDRAAASLVDLVATVAGRLGPTGPVVLGGGLLVHEHALQSRVRDGIAALAATTADVSADVRVLAADPVTGAVRLAEQLLATADSPTLEG